MIKKITLLLLTVAISTTYAQTIPTGYYDHATGTGYALKTQLKEIIDDVDDASITVNEYIATDEGYAALWTAYQNVNSGDKDEYPFSPLYNFEYEDDGTLLDMYSESPTGTDPYNFTMGTNQCGSYSGEGDCYNREHTFPQGFFNSHEPMKNDYHFVVPVDGYTNGRRGNSPYGNVATASWTSANGSRLGSSATPGFSGNVFEPIDEFKGDFARCLLYFAVRYEDKAIEANAGGNWDLHDASNDNPMDGSSDRFYEQWYINLLMTWHYQDPPSQKEFDRNDNGFVHQNNRNPFIDHPEWVNEIWTNTLGTEDYISDDFSIYPNPTHSSTVYINKGNNTIKQLELYSISGKLIMSKNIKTTHSIITLDNLNTIASGMYLLKIHTDKNSVVKKLVIN